MVADWWGACTAHPDEPAVMLAGRRSDIDRLNALARAVRKDAGQLTGVKVDVAGRCFAVGEDILAVANDSRLVSSTVTGARSPLSTRTPAGSHM